MHVENAGRPLEAEVFPDPKLVARGFDAPPEHYGLEYSGTFLTR